MSGHGGPSVLLILDTHTGQFGGTEQNTLRFAQALLGRGYLPVVVEVGLPVLGNFIESAGLAVRNIPATVFGDVMWPDWRALLAEIRPVVVVRSKCWVGCVNWRLDVVARLTAHRYLGWEHHPAVGPTGRSHRLPPLGVRRLKEFVRSRLHARAVHRSAAVSNAVRDPLLRYFPVPSGRVDVIYPGVDFHFFARQTPARREVRAKWGIPEQAMVIGSLGRLVPHKGNDLIPRVTAELLRRDPLLDVWCVLAGRGDDLDRLRSLAESLGIASRVRFPGWQESAPRAWSALDVFLMPSSDEGLGVATIEAIGCGRLTLAAAVGGMPEILSGPLTPYALPFGDLTAWTDSTERLLRTSAAEREQLLRVAHESVRTRFYGDAQWDLMVDWLRDCSR